MKRRKKKNIGFDWSQFCDTYIVMDDENYENPILHIVKVNGEYKQQPDKVRLKLNKQKGIYEEDENQNF